MRKVEAEEIRSFTQELPSFEPWEQTIKNTRDLQASLPKPNQNDPVWLRLQAGVLEAQSLIAPATLALQVDVVKQTNTLPVPYQIGLLRALSRNIVLEKPKRAPFIDALNLHYAGDTRDLTLEDYVFGPRDPIQFAAALGSVIVETQERLSKRKSTPAAVLSVGSGRPLYLKPTNVAYYLARPLPLGLLCEQPRLTQTDSGTESVEFKVPRLAVVRARIDERSWKLAEVTSPDRDNSTTIPIPKIEMMEHESTWIEPRKLLLGEEVIAFAKKHKKDREEDRRKAAARRQSELELSRMRF